MKARFGIPQRWIMLSFPFLIGFLLHLLLFATAPMVARIVDEMNLSFAEFGLIYSASMASLILFRIPWGILVDRIGYPCAFRIALPASAAAALLRSFSSSYEMLLTSQILLGVALAAVLPSLPLILKDWVESRNLGFATGLYIAGFAAGNATALGVTPYLLGWTTWRKVLLYYSLLGMGISVLWWLFAKGREKIQSGFHLQDFSSLLKSRLVWVLLLFMSASMGCYDTLSTWAPKVLEMKGLSPSLASLLPLGFFFAGPIVGFLSDRFQNPRSAVAFLGVMAAAAITAINVLPYPLLLFFLFLSGFSTMGVLTITLALPGEREELSSTVGTVVGLISSLGNIGPLVMPFLFGLLIDFTSGFHASVYFVAAVAGLTFILGSWGIQTKK